LNCFFTIRDRLHYITTKAKTKKAKGKKDEAEISTGVAVVSQKTKCLENMKKKKRGALKDKDSSNVTQGAREGKLPATEKKSSNDNIVVAQVLTQLGSKKSLLRRL
jgi:hypothetical protein